jgi:excisionase family DNA binding protein
VTEPRKHHDDALLTTAEVAELFGVDSGTVIRWGRSGRLPSIRTPGGRRRYRASEVHRLRLAGTTYAASPTNR